MAPQDFCGSNVQVPFLVCKALECSEIPWRRALWSRELLDITLSTFLKVTEPSSTATWAGAQENGLELQLWLQPSEPPACSASQQCHRTQFLWWGALLLLHLSWSLLTHTKRSDPKATGLLYNLQPRPSIICFSILASLQVSWKQGWINGVQSCFPFLWGSTVPHWQQERKRSLCICPPLPSRTSVLGKQHGIMQDTGRDREH